MFDCSIIEHPNIGEHKGISRHAHVAYVGSCRLQNNFKLFNLHNFEFYFQEAQFGCLKLVGEKE